VPSLQPASEISSAALLARVAFPFIVSASLDDRSRFAKLCGGADSHPLVLIRECQTAKVILVC
jgi:hypothetical protein